MILILINNVQKYKKLAQTTAMSHPMQLKTAIWRIEEQSALGCTTAEGVLLL